MNEIEKSRISEIHELHAEIGGYLRMTLDKAIRIGELLQEQKAGMKHGEWLPWIEENLPFDVRTAQRYTLLYDNRGRLKNDIKSYLKVSDAYTALRREKIEEKREAARQQNKLSLTGFYRFQLEGTEVKYEGQNGDGRHQWTIIINPNEAGRKLNGRVEQEKQQPWWIKAFSAITAEEQEAEALRKEADRLEKKARHDRYELELQVGRKLGRLYGSIWYYTRTFHFWVDDQIHALLEQADCEGQQEILSACGVGSEGTAGDMMMAGYVRGAYEVEGEETKLEEARA